MITCGSFRQGAKGHEGGDACALGSKTRTAAGRGDARCNPLETPPLHSHTACPLLALVATAAPLPLSELASLAPRGGE